MKNKVIFGLGILLVLGLVLFAMNINYFFPSPDIDLAFTQSLGSSEELRNYATSGITGEALTANLAENSDADVVIEEFSDFECPFCKQQLPILKQVKSVYGDKVAIVYRHFPISQIHPNAYKAAEASECAKDQGKFWEYHDLIFQNQDRVSRDALEAYAAKLNLNMDQFNECMDTNQKFSIVQADFAEGSSRGVQGTPTLFINGQMLVGAQSFAKLKEVIDNELK